MTVCRTKPIIGETMPELTAHVSLTIFHAYGHYCKVHLTFASQQLTKRATLTKCERVWSNELHV